MASKKGKSFQLKKITYKFPYKKVRQKNKAPLEGKYNIADRISRFTGVAAKSSMRPQPKKPRAFESQGKTLYGHKKAYSQKAYQKRQAKYGTGTSKTFWRKGLYSRPGQPPFYDRKNSGSLFASLRGGMVWSVKMNSTSYSKLNVGGHLSYPGKGGPPKKKGYIAGPLFRRGGQFSSTPVPALHEHGGTQTNKAKTHTGRNGVAIRHRTPGTTRYPKRPYMAPAGIKAQKDIKVKYKSRKIMGKQKPRRKWGLVK